MGKFENFINSAVAGQRLSEIEDQLNEVKNSGLTLEQKEKAIKSQKKMITTSIVVVILVCVFMLLSFIYGFEQKENELLFITAPLFVGPFILTIYSLLIKKIFPDWANYYNLVDKGFDGLSNDQIEFLSPSDNEIKLVKSYKRKNIVANFIFLATLAFEIFIVIKIEFPVYHPVTIVITTIIAIVWYIFQDNYQVEIHRIESGYYKKGFVYKCKACQKDFNIEYKDINKFNTVEKDKNGIRTVNCQNCNSPISLYNFDINVNDYQNYINKVNK